jgi:hypothetical protein
VFRSISKLLTDIGLPLFNGYGGFEIDQDKKSRNVRIALSISSKITIMRSNFFNQSLDY